MERLIRLLNKEKKLIIGLMSGTSIDGIDCALVEIEGNGLNTIVRLVGFYNYPIAIELKNEILKACSIYQSSVDLICRLNFKIGEEFAKAVIKTCDLAGVSLSEIDLVGSHGQTIYHIPQDSTLQIGEQSIIAERTGIVTVADFRVRDVSAGGHGAPLVPYTEYLLYRKHDMNLALQNIGGIGNVTILPKNCNIDDVIAFDTGPGNMIIDAMMNAITDGKMKYDEDGKLALKGKINFELINELKSHPFIHKTPPKTSGREEFGDVYSRKILEKYQKLNVSNIDIVTTVTYFTALSIGENFRNFILPKYSIDKMIISGGGSYNKTLINMIKEELKGIEVVTGEDIGLSSDAKEAIAFAILANETIHGNSNNIPNVTGAKAPVVMGKIVY